MITISYPFGEPKELPIALLGKHMHYQHGGIFFDLAGEFFGILNIAYEVSHEFRRTHVAY